jgi:tetratricopeptide (TPR) repeat protein
MPPKPKTDLFSSVALAVAALVAVIGFAAMFSRWWQSGISDPQEVLRIASQEFVAGDRITAGDLAETVTFDLEPEMVPDNPDDPVSPDLDASHDLAPNAADPDAADPDGAISDQAANEIANNEKQASWIRLRDFLIGAGKLARAQEENQPRARRAILMEAADSLQASADGGFPEGRKTQGFQMLGSVLYELGQHDAATAPLEKAMQRDPTQQRTLLPMIADSKLRQTTPAPSQALQSIKQFLDDPGLQITERWVGELIQLRALTDLKRYRDVDQAVSEIRSHPKVNDPTLEGEEIDFFDHVSLLSAIASVKQQIDRAKLIQDNQSQPAQSNVAPGLERSIRVLGELGREASPRISARARLWQARALELAGRQDDALVQLTTVRQQRPFGAESIVAGLEEIEWLADRGRGVEVLQTTRYMMRELGDRSGFDAELVSFSEFRRRMLESLAALRRAGDFSSAIDTARSLAPVFELAETLTQEGIAYTQWAESTIEDGTNVNGELARGSSVLARSRYRASGDAYAAAAKELFNTAEFVPAQWNAIEAYQKGRHFRRSIVLLKDYLRYEQRGRLPRGLVAYGRALLAEGKTAVAMKALESCIVEYPRDPLRYDARLMVAMAKIEQKKNDEAKQFLMENLQDGDLTPDSPAWRDSLFTIAELHYDLAYQKHLEAERSSPKQRTQQFRDNQPNLEQAIRFLDQAVARYWPQRRAESAAYLSARAHVLAAELPRTESKSTGILESARRSMKNRVDQELKIAKDGFSNLKRHLLTREEDSRLPPKELRMLRNCFMAEAEMLRSMDRLEEAAQAYRTIELRYINEPLVLEAILNRAACVRGLGRQSEADLLIRQASVILERIPETWDGRFDETTRFDRNGWQQYLAWMTRRMNNGNAS